MTQTASALAYEFLKPQFTPRAPMGCLQYFTQPSGIIESFNFGQYLNQMDYSICIQRQSDTCRVVFTSSDYDWSLNGVGVSSSSSGVGDQDCARDYLLIPGASRTGDGFTYDRYCGGRLHFYRGQSLSAPVVVKTSGPIVLRFHSDAHFESLNNGGFRLQYDQSAQDCFQHAPEEAGSLSSQQLLAATLSDSRPLSSMVESVPQMNGPVLYASQQHSDFDSDTHHHHQLFNSHSDLISSPTPNGTITTASALDGNGIASDNQQQQQQIDRNEQQHQQQQASIKRNDFIAQTTSDEPTSWTKTTSNHNNYAMQILDGSALKYDNNNNGYPSAKVNGGGGLSLADLTKAFQLITTTTTTTTAGK